MAMKKYYKKLAAKIYAIPMDFEESELHYQKWGSQQRAKQGDWLVYNDGDVYTVEQESFAQTYQNVDGCTYLKNAPVWAEIASISGKMKTKEGFSVYRAGDYLVYNNSDKTDGYAMSKQSFENSYQNTPSEKENSLTMNANDYLVKRIDDQIDWYEKKSSLNQKRYKQLQLAAIIFSSAIPLLTAISFESLEIVIRFVIALLGALIAVTSAVLTLYKFQENWVNYRATAEALTQQRLLYLTRISPYDSDEHTNFTQLVTRCESIMSDERSGWIKSSSFEKEPGLESQNLNPAK